MRIDTAAIHPKNDNNEHAHLVPIYASSTFTFDSAEQGMARFTKKEKGYTYSRFGNPTTAAAAQLIADLEAFGVNDENGKPLQAKGLLHASGQSAMSTMFMSNVKQGDTILSNISLYGGTFEFLNDFVKNFGVKTIFLDLRNTEEVERTLAENPSITFLHIETPANPTMHCTDIAKVCAIAKKYKVTTGVDNTFATPYLQQPFAYGADYIFHSTTKFLNGHGTSIGGVLIGKDLQSMNGKVYNTHKLLGGNSNPFDAFMLIQGIKTLAIRMEKHCMNAMAVSTFLNNHQAIKKVHYNGLQTHPDYSVSTGQMRHHGAVLSFELKEGFEKAVSFINKLQVCTRAVSLGTIDTLISHPASMSHSGMSREDRIRSGVDDGLIRMSVGIEHIDDIIEDLDQALS
jgi:methionine-gamma-lyase